MSDVHKGVPLTVCVKLIKKLSATPVLLSQNDVQRPLDTLDSQAALQANKATFFFQLVSTMILAVEEIAW